MDDPIQNVPEENRIEEMLSQFAPQPTSRFYMKISDAPWQRQNHTRADSISRFKKPSQKMIWGGIAIGLVLLLLLFTFFPSLRVAASQIIHLFLPSSTNQLEVQVTLTSPGDLPDFSDPTNFPLSVKEVQQLAGYGVKEISLLPEGLTLVGSRYDIDYKTVTLLYIAHEYKLFLTQRPIRNGDDVFSIGASANVKQVKIGNIDGEFVKGGWKAIATQPGPNNQTPASTVNLYAIWDNELAQYTLRWQLGGIVYELRCDGEGSPSQSEIINLANELK